MMRVVFPTGDTSLKLYTVKPDAPARLCEHFHSDLFRVGAQRVCFILYQGLYVVSEKPAKTREFENKNVREKSGNFVKMTKNQEKCNFIRVYFIRSVVREICKNGSGHSS
uniref:Uncharacterized protein n=1 Tax=Cacopsylla melanoneura TaxID=428564 RepID=A0A8D8RCS8_9HEMI